MAVCMTHSKIAGTSKFYAVRKQVISPKRFVAASAVVQPLSVPAPSSGAYRRDPELQAALDALFADTVHKGRRRVPREEIQQHIDRIADLGRRLGLNRVHPDWNDGAFREVITTNTTGVSPDGLTTLQRLTFGMVRPGDAAVSIHAEEEAGAAGRPNQIKGPLAAAAGGAADSYALMTHFKLLGDGALGRMTVKAQYDTADQDPAKLGVTFLGYKVEPASPDAQSLALWREALGEHNPSMGENGAIEITFPKAPRAALNYILMEPDLQLSLGGSGDFLTVQRVAAA